MTNTYTFDQLIEKFNPDKVITRAEMLELKKLCALHIQTSNNSSEESTSSTSTQVDAALIEQGFKIQERIEEGKEAAKNKLISIFYGITLDVVNNLSSDIFEDCWGTLQEANPRILGFLHLSESQSLSLPKES